MTEAELLSALAGILAAETADPPHWVTVAERSSRLLAKLRAMQASDLPPAFWQHAVWHYLDDWDIRQRDPAYARLQRDDLAAYLATLPRPQ